MITSRDIVTDTIIAAKAAVEAADRRLQLGRQAPVDWPLVAAGRKERMRAWQRLAAVGETLGWDQMLVRAIRLAGHSDAVSASQAAKR